MNQQQPERDEWYCDCGRINPRGQVVCDCGNASKLCRSGERVPLPRHDLPSVACEPVSGDA